MQETIQFPLSSHCSISSSTALRPSRLFLGFSLAPVSRRLFTRTLMSVFNPLQILSAPRILQIGE